MAKYHVDSNAVGLNDGSSWANAYVSDSAAIAGSVTTDDTVWRAHNHAGSYAVSTTHAWPDGVTVISVNSTTDAYQVGGIESTTNNFNDLTMSGADGRTFNFIGCSWSTGDDFSLSSTSSHYNFDECVFTIGSVTTGAKFKIWADGVSAKLNNCSFTFPSNATTGFSVFGGSKIIIDNPTLIFGATKPNYLFTAAGNGGGCIDVRNSGLTGFDSTKHLFSTATNEDSAKYTATRCKLAATQNIIPTILGPNCTADLQSCDTGDGYYYFAHHRYWGIVLQSTTVKRTGGATYDGTSGFSAEFQPNSNVKAYTQPLRIKIAEKELDLTSANTLTFHIAFGDNTSAITAFKNDEMWIEIEQNSDAATSKALGITIDSKPTDILTAGTTLTASTESWTSNATTLELDYTNSDKRQIAITTTVVSGMTNGQVTAYLCCAKSVSTLEVFVCTSPVIT